MLRERHYGANFSQGVIARISFWPEDSKFYPPKKFVWGNPGRYSSSIYAPLKLRKTLCVDFS